MIFKGKMEGQSAEMLMDDGCNTNLVSKDSVNKRSLLFDLLKCNISVAHSKKDSTEPSKKLILNGRLCIGSNFYVSNWAVEDLLYEVLLGMP